MIEAASPEELAENARILALQAAAYARRVGELPIEDHLDDFRAQQTRSWDALQSPEGERLIGLLKDGTVALIGVLSVVSEATNERRSAH
jgi:hypothetical protein